MFQGINKIGILVLHLDYTLKILTIYIRDMYILMANLNLHHFLIGMEIITEQVQLLDL